MNHEKFLMFSEAAELETREAFGVELAKRPLVVVTYSGHIGTVRALQTTLSWELAKQDEFPGFPGDHLAKAHALDALVTVETADIRILWGQLVIQRVHHVAFRNMFYDRFGF